METIKKMSAILIWVASLVLLAAIIVCMMLFSSVKWLLPLLALVAGAGLAAVAYFCIRLQRTIAEEEEHAQYYSASCQLANSEKLQEDFSGLEDKDGYAFVLIQLNDFNQLASLFGFQVSQQTVLHLMPLLEDFADGHNGTAYRIAVDMFAILTPFVAREPFLRSLRELMEKMEKVNVKDEHIEYSFHYTFSYGVYFMTDNENSIDDIAPLLSMGLSALDRLEDTPRTMETVFSTKHQPNWELQDILHDQIAQAWKSRQFVPYFQMAYDCKTRRPVGAELLIRWNHPEYGLLLPHDFLPVVESEGYMMNLDLYMMEEACKKIKSWMHAELVTVPLSVNISKLNIHRKDFCKQLIAMCENYGIPPILIELELNEEVLLYAQNEEFMEVINQLHDYGFAISIDNFASSHHSSLNLLRDLPVSVVKVTSRFFNNVGDRERDSTFVESVIEMANKMNIKIVAMGVETVKQAQLYQHFGCRFAQGYYFSKPVSNEEFEKVIF